ncbi:hypothetical protein [Pseudomonas sp. RIT-PI-AD]|uniref:hypothetical protein n=1 Tax=Pseudomonas sp. RIT-PI-AD TaxID=3035294 RepID=UPI0021D7DFF1|nr:hypothetical protein [Pseudomonas sp. RIT-PI-AD]
MIPLGWSAAGVLGLAVVLTLWRADHLDSERAFEQRRAELAEHQRDEKQGLIDLQGGVLAEQQRQLGMLTDIDMTTRQLSMTLTRQGADHARAIEELKRNDQVVADYLRGVVPAALGVRYARRETTDPAIYRGGPAGPVPADPLPPAGPAGDRHH